MRISFSSLIAWTLAVACLATLPLVSHQSHAAGLGRLAVLSALGQPLNAEVEIISLQPGEEETLSARLAPMDAFRQAGIEFNPALLNVRFAIEQRSGKPILRITSAQPVNEPFLDLLVELQWSNGRLVREYTFLLDPPAFRAPPSVAAPAVPAAPAPAPSAAPAAPVTPSAAAPSEPVKAEPLAAPRPGAEPARSGATYQVKRGDTLAGIARENAVQGATFNQMLVALFRANSDAFDGANVNRLRAGRILNVPEREAAVAIEPEEARRFLQSQASDFAQYRRGLAGALAAAPGESTGGQRSAAGAITAPARAPSGAAPKDELKLSKADTQKPSAAASKAARGDDAASNDRALREAQSRVSDLEKTVADLQKLLELKNKQMAELESKSAKPAAPAAGAAPAPAKPAATPTPPPAPAPAAAPPAAAKADAPSPAKPAPEAAKSAAPEAAKAPAAADAAKATAPAPSAPGDAAQAPATDAAKAPTPVPAPAAPKPAAKAKPAPAAPPPPPPSMVDEFLDNPMALLMLGVVVLLLVAYGFWAWRKKKKAAQASFQDSSLGVPTIAGAAAAGAAAGAAAPAFAEPTLAGAAPAAAAIGMEPEEVDPVAEADVYMAYGRDAQAEEILKEALQKDPSRVPVLGKLAEIYAHRKDGKALEQTALKLKNLTGGSGPDWDKAAGLGKSIDPQNGLYSGAGGAAEVPAAATPSPALDFDLDSASAAAQPGAAEPAGPDATVDFDLGAPAPQAAGAAEPEKAADATGGLDFDLGASDSKEEPRAAAPAPAEAAPAADAGLDFDLGMGDEAKAPEAPAAATGGEPDLGLALDFEPGKPAADAPKEKAAAPEGDSVDFDLDLDLGGAGTSSDASAKPAEAPPLDLSSISLDLDLPAESAAGGQDLATKLELAKAYEEMGDKSGARDLLNEVIKDGDPAQQSQAKEMLVRLG